MNLRHLQPTLAFQAHYSWSQGWAQNGEQSDEVVGLSRGNHSTDLVTMPRILESAIGAVRSLPTATCKTLRTDDPSVWF
jgi:hypothetical protein